MLQGYPVGQVGEKPDDHFGVGDTDRPGDHRRRSARPLGQRLAEVHDQGGRPWCHPRHSGQPRCRRPRTQGFHRTAGLQVHHQPHPQGFQIGDPLTHRPGCGHQRGLRQPPHLNPAGVRERNAWIHNSNDSASRCPRQASVFEHCSACERRCSDGGDAQPRCRLRTRRRCKRCTQGRRVPEMVARTGDVAARRTAEQQRVAGTASSPTARGNRRTVRFVARAFELKHPGGALRARDGRVARSPALIWTTDARRRHGGQLPSWATPFAERSVQCLPHRPMIASST